MIKKIIFIGLFINTNLFSQINIEKYNNLSENLGIFGKSSFYISAKTGNTDIQEFGVDARLNLKENKFYTFLIAQGEYGWNKGKEFSNNALLHFRYIRELNSVFKPEFYSQINYNRSRLLDFRALAGLGIRYSLILDSLKSLSLGTAYMFEHEEIDLHTEAIHPSQTNHNRLSTYINYSSQLTSNTRISVVIYAQPRFDLFSDMRILSENHFGVNLNSKLSLSINFSLQYDSRPPDDIKNLDTNSKVGLTINF
jgi:hypothetical protein